MLFPFLFFQVEAAGFGQLQLVVLLVVVGPPGFRFLGGLGARVAAGGTRERSVDLAHALLPAVYQGSQREEGLLHVLPSLRTRLDEVNPLFRTPLADFSEVDLGFEVLLAAQEHEVGLGNPLGGHIVPGGLDALPTLLAGEVEHQDHPVAGLEVGGHDRPVPLLTRSVPNAQTDHLVLHLDLFVAEVHRRHRTFAGLLIFYVSPENRRLACPALPYQDYLVTKLLRKVTL